MVLAPKSQDSTPLSQLWRDLLLKALLFVFAASLLFAAIDLFAGSAAPIGHCCVN
jgi:hypothetical protein